jgi:hypothetical protein
MARLGSSSCSVGEATAITPFRQNIEAQQEGARLVQPCRVLGVEESCAGRERDMGGPGLRGGAGHDRLGGGEAERTADMKQPRLAGSTSCLYEWRFSFVEAGCGLESKLRGSASRFAVYVEAITSALRPRLFNAVRWAEVSVTCDAGGVQ